MKAVLAVLSLALAVVRAQDSITSINSDVPSSDWQAGITVTFVGDVDTKPGRAITLSSFELLTGSATSFTVVDVMGWNLAYANYTYTFPAGLPAGNYLIRYNCTTDTSPTGAPQQLTKLTPVLPIQAGKACSPGAPIPPWRGVSSPSDPNYTSFVFDNPLAGEMTITNLGLGVIGYQYRDGRNAGGAGIGAINVEICEFGKDNQIGRCPQHFALSPSGNSLTVDYTPIFNVGRGILRVKYTNQFEQNGAEITYLSDVFYVIDPDAYANGSGCDSWNATTTKNGGGGGGAGQRSTELPVLGGILGAVSLWLFAL